MAQITILMYHRVIQQTKYNICYFERGTAVEPDIFESQLKWLINNFTIVSLAEAVNIAAKNKEGNYCALTFDDGYSEIKDFIWPLCKQLKIPICIFPIAGHTGESTIPAYIDHYYAILHFAKKRDTVDLKFLGIDQYAPGIDENTQWWVNGLLKKKLHTLSVKEQSALLDNLGQLLNSKVPDNFPKELYLTKQDIANLYAEGVEIGGHGYHHKRLGDANNRELEFEIIESIRFLNEIGLSNPKIFCYPDGSYSEKVKQSLQQNGINIACTTKKGIYCSNASAMELPRFFIRNITPDNENFLGRDIAG